MGDFDVKFKLVADINRKGEGARVVPDTVRETKPRVDIKTEVETGGAKPIKAKQDDGRGHFDHAAGATNTSDVPVQAGPPSAGKGTGVLGHLIGMKRSIPDPEAVTWQQLRAALEPHFGKPVVVTNYDREEATSLAQAKNTLGDNEGILRNVTAEGVEL